MIGLKTVDVMTDSDQPSIILLQCQLELRPGKLTEIVPLWREKNKIRPFVRSIILLKSTDYPPTSQTSNGSVRRRRYRPEYRKKNSALQCKRRQHNTQQLAGRDDYREQHDSRVQFLEKARQICYQRTEFANTII